MSISSFMGYLKEKSGVIIYKRWGNTKYKYRNRQFWCRGYYVDTVGKNAEAIKSYIENQLKEDKMSEQLTIDKIDPFTGARNKYASGESGYAFKQCQNMSHLCVSEKPLVILVVIFLVAQKSFF